MPTSKPITILGVDGFNVTFPYEAGHTLTEAEAKVLNQTRRENLGNNFRKSVQDYLDKQESGDTDAPTLAALQAEFVDLDANYIFTLSNAGTSRVVKDPVEKEARKLAKEAVIAKLAENGMKFNVAPEGYTDDQWAEVMETNVEAFAADEQIVKMAKNIVKERSKTANITLAGLNLGGPVQEAAE
jgi:hypothetical protein